MSLPPTAPSPLGSVSERKASGAFSTPTTPPSSSTPSWSGEHLRDRYGIAKPVADPDQLDWLDEMLAADAHKRWVDDTLTTTFGPKENYV